MTQCRFCNQTVLFYTLDKETCITCSKLLEQLQNSTCADDIISCWRATLAAKQTTQPHISFSVVVATEDDRTSMVFRNHITGRCVGSGGLIFIPEQIRNEVIRTVAAAEAEALFPNDVKSATDWARSVLSRYDFKTISAYRD